MNRLATPFLLALLMAPVGCRTRGDVQRDYADKFWPEEISAPMADPGTPVHAVKLRIYVDEEYRTHVLGWQAKVTDQIERANEFLVPSFHVKFVPDIRPWQRASNSSQLEAALAELEKTDLGSDVDWVLGLTGVLPLASPNLHRIGLARRFSKHMVAHAM